MSRLSKPAPTDLSTAVNVLQRRNRRSHRVAVDHLASIPWWVKHRILYPRYVFEAPSSDSKDYWIRGVFGWPLQNHIIQRPPRTSTADFVNELRTHDFKVVVCLKTNDLVQDFQRELSERFPFLTVERFVSKARHLIERLREIGVVFNVSYYEAASPYEAGALNKQQTLLDLREALDAAGFEHLDHELIFDQEFTEYKSPPFDANTDVYLYTLAAFRPLLAARKHPWWVHFGLSTGTKWIHPDWLEFPKEVPISSHPLAMVVVDPSEAEFDEQRLVMPHHVQTLMDAKAAHWIIKEGDDHYELRPDAQRFSKGLRRGFGNSSSWAPALIVLTSNQKVVEEPRRSLMSPPEFGGVSVVRVKLWDRHAMVKGFLP